MPDYSYYCQHCAEGFEVKKPMSEASRIEECRRCGQVAERRYAPLSSSFGWRLTPESHDSLLRQTRQGGKDKIERAI